MQLPAIDHRKNAHGRHVAQYAAPVAVEHRFRRKAVRSLRTVGMNQNWHATFCRTLKSGFGARGKNDVWILNEDFAAASVNVLYDVFGDVVARS